MEHNHQRSKKAAYRHDKKLLILFNTVISIVLAVSLFATTALGLAAYMLGDSRQGIISKEHEDLGIDTDEVKNLPKEIINIALFGLDTRDKNATNRDEALSGRSDTIIIVSVNTIDNTIKLTSILRDSWVPMKTKRGSTTTAKINAAYSIGGAQNALHCLNSNFKLNIEDYVSVSLYQLWNVIDIMGGVDIEITEWERKQVNYFGKEENFNVDTIEQAGLVHMDGGQAMVYARIRTDSEEIRVLRQQKVLSALFEKLKAMPVTSYPNLLREVLSNVETSMSFDDIIAYSPMLANADLHLQSTAIPGKEVVAKGGIFDDTNGGWVWKYDLTEAKNYIYKWIYGIE